MDHPDRHGTWSLKWDRWRGRPGVLPLWVADMDHPAPPCVLDSLRQRLDHGILGYTRTPEDLSTALAGWLSRRHGWTIDPTWVVPFPGTMVAAHAAGHLCGEPGSGAAIITPLYPPLMHAPETVGRRGLCVPMLGLEVDWAGLERAAADARSLWLCSPHNPSGRVWTRSELERFAALAERHDLTILSDEVWMDLVLEPGVRHIPIASLSPAIAARTITLVAPSKTFNLPGLGLAVAIIPDAQRRAAIRRIGAGLIPYVHLMALIGGVAAWSEGDAWLDGLIPTLRSQRDRAVAVARSAGFACHSPQSTYLLWFDARSKGWSDPAATCLDAGLGLSDGSEFGAPGWLRLNCAADPTTFDRAMELLAGLA